MAPLESGRDRSNMYRQCSKMLFCLAHNALMFDRLKHDVLARVVSPVISFRHQPLNQLGRRGIALCIAIVFVI